MDNRWVDSLLFTFTFMFLQESAHFVRQCISEIHTTVVCVHVICTYDLHDVQCEALMLVLNAPHRRALTYPVKKPKLKLF